ncbi:bestrophin-like domain [Nonomuraea soli]|uniref:bestrophin-like domain n=1 Tax=Nonomuraea soli TaxID=1032476 RepID=UPI0024841513
MKRWQALLGALLTQIAFILLLRHSTLPAWADAVAVVTLALLFARFALTLLRRAFPLDGLSRGDNDVINGTFAIVGSVYAILVGSAIMVVWQGYTQTQATIVRESNAVVMLGRMSRGFSAPVQRQVQGAARSYLRLVVQEEWPLMAFGRSSERADATLVEIWSAYTDMEDRERASPLYSQSLTKLNELTDSRRQRMLAAGDRVPGLVWVMLYIGASAKLATGSLFVVRSRGLHLLLIGVLAGVLMLSLYIVSALDGPFDRNLPVSPEPFIRAWTGMPPLEV